jgi:hypothetical protein
MAGNFATQQNESAYCLSRDPWRVGALEFFVLTGFAVRRNWQKGDKN